MDDYDKMLAFFGDRPPGRVLDLPCGAGELTRRLLARGYTDIVCVDIDETGFDATLPVEFLCLDLNEPLPLADGSFDYIFCREGVEHLVAPFQFLGELARLLRPEGYLYLSTPNIMSLDSRLKFLMSGYFTQFKDLRYNWENLQRQHYQGHISPIYLWQLLFFLEKYGLQTVGVTCDALMQEKRWHKKLLKQIFAALVCRGRRQRFPVPLARRELLYGSSLIVGAQKVR